MYKGGAYVGSCAHILGFELRNLDQSVNSVLLPSFLACYLTALSLVFSQPSAQLWQIWQI